MSYKGPSLAITPGKPVALTIDRYWWCSRSIQPTPPTPAAPSPGLRSTSPSKLGGHRVDLRLRPIPLSPEGVR